jgi:hypothetical protein
MVLVHKVNMAPAPDASAKAALAPAQGEGDP